MNNMNQIKAIIESLNSSYIEFEWEDGNDFVDGNDEFYLYAIVNKNRIAEVKYHVSGNPTIDHIEVDPEYRRSGIGSQLIEKLVDRYGDYKKIYWNSLYPSGLKLKNKLDNQYGLTKRERDANWYGMVEDEAEEWS